MSDAWPERRAVLNAVICVRVGMGPLGATTISFRALSVLALGSSSTTAIDLTVFFLNNQTRETCIGLSEVCFMKTTLK